MKRMCILIHAFEESNYSMPLVSGAEVLRYLMTEYDLRQTDLHEIGSQSVVSEILNAKES